MYHESLDEILNDPQHLSSYDAVNIYYKDKHRFRTIKGKGRKFDVSALEPELDSTRLYITLANRVKRVHLRQKRLNQGLKQAIQVDIDKSRKILKNLVAVTLSEPRTELIKQMKATVSILVDEYLANPHLVENLTIISLHDYSTQIHLINVMILCIGYAYYNQLDRKDLKIYGLLGLTHDIGKVGISDYLLQAPRKLTPEEFEEIKKHPALSAQKIKNCEFGSQIMNAALEHHERLDGSGYPLGKRAHEISEYSKVLSIIDTFEALTSCRPYTIPKSPIKALEIINKDVIAGKLDVFSFKTFAKSIVGMKYGYSAIGTNRLMSPLLQ